MGMAASQARFLSLTARKSNVEYEGQQVNQERTALANESANLFNKLSSLPVPTPPATSDYYRTTYTFTTTELNTSSATGATEYSLDSIYSTPQGPMARLSYDDTVWQYAVSSFYAGTLNSSYDKDSDSRTYSVDVNGTHYDAFEYHKGTAEVPETSKKVNDLIKEAQEQAEEYEGLMDAYNNYKDHSDPSDEQHDELYGAFVDVLNKYLPEGSLDGVSNLRVNQDGSVTAEVVAYVDKDGKTNASMGYLPDSFFKYEVGDDKGDWGSVLAYTINGQTFFISAQDSYEAVHNKNETSSQNYTFKSAGYAAETTQKKVVEYPCKYTTTDAGRYQALVITDENGIQHTFDLKVTSIQDEELYDQAMMDYEYDQQVYQQKIKEINAKTESIQQQDRTLELRLRQLDTEQNAIATEMEAVQKVIEDNIEATFKTFA